MKVKLQKDNAVTEHDAFIFPQNQYIRNFLLISLSLKKSKFVNTSHYILPP